MFENLITSIENGIKLVDGLYHIKNCLSQSELNLCKELYKSPGEKVPLQEDRPRLQRIVDFDFSKCEATAHSLVVGDTIYIDQGTSNTTTTSKTYTVDTVIDANNFTTTPALDGTGKLTLYSAIFFAERFTNGPYEIQNQGDQIKVTLNVSLD